jgi:D-alanyl-D-alanine carboxypeptidase/D-alanyl-D-alanine-endopeptidase (penicillin-binding protein 4)
VVIGKPGDKTQVGIEVKPSVGEGPSTVRVWGTIAPGDRPRRLVMRSPDTLTLFGDRMQRALAAAGITVEGRVRAGDTPSTATPVHVVRSAPLGEILRASLGGSIEFDHETFAVAAAHAQNGRQPVTVADGVAGLRAFLASEVKLERFVVKNASGLGNVNRLSSHDIAKLLRYAAAHDRTAPMLDALARPGAPHTTLVTRMIGTEAETALAAKTGTEGRNIALSGVVHPPQGRPVVFSTIASSRQRPEARAIVDSVGITLSRLRASPPPAVAAPRP